MMKKIITMAFLALTVGVFAQTNSIKDSKQQTQLKSQDHKDVHGKKGKKGKKGHHRGGFQKDLEALDLTADQKVKLDEFKKATKEQMRSKDGEKPSKEEIQKMKAEKEAQLKQILTKEQYEKFEEIKKERKEQVQRAKSNNKVNIK